MVQIRKLSPELAKRAKDELNENEGRLRAGIHLLKEWLKLMPHIKEPLGDQWLAAFLRGSKFSLERAQEKLEKFYTARTLIPEFFKNRNPTISPIREFIRKGCFLPLENKTDPAGPSLSYFRTPYDPAEFSVEDLLKYNFLLLDLRIVEEDNVSICGTVNICDLKDVTFQHLTPFTPTIAKKCLKTFEQAYPVPTTTTHFLNAPPIFETTLNLMKIFLPAKMKNRLYVHENIESLYEHVPRENLPNEYGGQAGTLDELTEKWVRKIENQRDFFIDSEKYCTDENLRPGGPIIADSEFSVCSVM